MEIARAAANRLGRSAKDGSSSLSSIRRQARATMATFSASNETPSGLQRLHGRKPVAWLPRACHAAGRSSDWRAATDKMAGSKRRSSRPNTRDGRRRYGRGRRFAPSADHRLRFSMISALVLLVDHGHIRSHRLGEEVIIVSMAACLPGSFTLPIVGSWPTQFL